MKIRVITLLGFLFCSLNITAGPFPVPLSITRTSDKIPQYRVIWTTIDIPEADAKAPTGFWFGSAKSVGFDFPVVQSETCVNTLCGTKVILGETISNAAMRAFKKGPATTYYEGGGGAKGNCIAFGGIPQGVNSYDAAILPTGCFTLPAANVFCFVVTPEINLNHGTVSLKDVGKSTATASFNINCSEKNNVKLSLNNTLTYIQLNNNAIANIMINSKKPGKQHSLPAGLSTLTITSQLEGITQGGVYQGSAVLIIEPV